MKTKTFFQGKKWAAGITLACLTACNPAPKYAKPPAQTPRAFKEAPPGDYKEGTGWKPAQPGDDRIRGKWWEIYNLGRAGGDLQSEHCGSRGELSVGPRAGRLRAVCPVSERVNSARLFKFSIFTHRAKF